MITKILSFVIPSARKKVSIGLHLLAQNTFLFSGNLEKRAAQAGKRFSSSQRGVQYGEVPKNTFKEV